MDAPRENATDKTAPECQSQSTSLRVLTSHIRTLLSGDPTAEARTAPSGENATDHTAPVCPRVATSSRLATSHSLTV